MIKLLAKIFIKDFKNYSDSKVREQYSIITGFFGIFLNIIASSLKITIGAISGSIAIVSDGLNNIADISSSVVAILGAKLSNMKPDKEHPFGHGRFEYIASLVVSFLIMFMGVELGIESVKKILNPTPVDFSYTIIIVLCISILIKVYMFIYNKIYGKKTHSMVLNATAMDSLYDSITSSVILLATILGTFINLPLDGISGCFVALLICYGGFNIAKESIGTILGIPPTNETVNKLSSLVLSGEGILGIHDLMIHDYGPTRQFASVHAEVDEKCNIVKAHEVIDAVEAKIFNEMGIITTIHMDPISTSKKVLEHKTIVEEAIKSIDPDFSIHDFRMVDGEKQINIIFDLVIPHHYLKHTKEEIMNLVKNSLKKINKIYYPVIQIETAYI